MKRLQVRLESDIRCALAERAYEEGCSMAAVARAILRRALLPETGSHKIERFAFLASGASGRRDVSVLHDAAFVEDI